MKNRWKAILLAAGLTAFALGSSAAAAEATSEVAAEVEALSEEAAEAAAGQAADGSQFAPYYDQMKASVAQTLEQLSAMTDEQLENIVSGTDAVNAAIAANWMSVKEELGAFVEVTEQTLTEEDNVITIDNAVTYDNVSEKTKVNVSYVYNIKENKVSLDWDIKYPMSKLIREAGLNTLLGLGIVFVVLLFLSFLISQIHWIPDLIAKREESKAAAAPAAPAPAVSAPEPVEEEDYSDDEELVAVIAAAIAAAEETAPNGFVVRSIKKANRSKWLGA